MATRAIARPSQVGAVKHDETLSEPRGLWSWITTIDHKRIGIMYLLLSIFYLFVGGIEAGLMRVQLSHPDNTFVSADTFNQLFTMHGTTMIFLAVMPMSAAFFNYLVPLMIGARDVAFPRLNAFSWWVLLFGSIVLNLGWFTGGAPNAGWFNYANLTSSAFSPGHNVDWWVLGIQILGLSSLATSFNMIVTIINMRAPGMGLMRMPPFVWMTLITAVLIVMAFPSLTVGTTFLMFDRFFDTNFFVPEAGGSPLLWQHLFWVFGHPEVYIMILPAFGIVSEIIPVFSRKPLFGYSAVIFSGIAIAILGFGVWAHHMFTVGMGPVPTSVFSLTTMLIALPTGVKIFNWTFTMWGGHLNLKSPMLFMIGFISMFIIGGISGVMHASPPVDMQQQDSYFVVAHFHYVLFGGSLFGLMGAIYYWFPKMSGRMFHEGLAKAHFVFMFLGFNFVFMPMHWLGLEGMPRRIYTYSEDTGWAGWNLFISLGLFVLVFSFILFTVNMLMSLVAGEKAPSDPWDSDTLEWSIPSPPPFYNFAHIPTVTTRVPLWTEKYPDVYGTGAHGSDSEPEMHNIYPAGEEPDASMHMPNPSIHPLILAFGITIGFLGLLIHPGVIVLGGAIAFIGLFGWVLQPAVGDGESHDEHDPVEPVAHTAR